MRVHEAGNRNGPKVLLLHPPLLSGRAMIDLCKELADTCHLIAPDIAGIDPTADGVYKGLPTAADRLDRGLPQLGHTHIDLVFGASMGATVAVYLAARARQVTFGRMVCEGATMFPKGSGGLTKRLARSGIRMLKKKLAGMGRDEAKRKIEAQLGPGLASGVDAFAETDPGLLDTLIDDAFTFDYPPIAPDVQQRLYLYWGSKEPQAGHRLFDERTYPGVHIKIWDDKNHCEALVRDRAGYLALLRRHLDEVAAGGAKA